MKDVNDYFRNLSSTIQRLPFATIEQIAEALLTAYQRDQTIYTFGNGGSAALASHFACDLGKGTVNGSGKRFRVFALTDNVPVMTAWANDSHYEDIFAEQLTNLVREGDVALAISGSGNSPNVLKALAVARDSGAVTVGLTGYKGGRLKVLCDLCLVVPSENMQIIEDMHLCVAHALFTVIKQKVCLRSEAMVAGTSCK
jgi:D-sedoheptulose 7-phosphate isomerase